MTIRILTAALVLLASAPVVAQTAALNTAPSPLAARMAALRAEASPAPDALVSVETADLELFVAASAEETSVGETVTITVTVANRGEGGAPDVQVAGPITTASLPAGLRLAAAASETGAFDAEKGLWYVGALAPQQEAVLHIDFVVTAEGSYAFLSEVASAGVDDIDSLAALGSQAPPRRA